MQTIDIQLKTIHDVKKFVQVVSQFPYDVDLVSGRYVVDAKSIMGIFSLDLTEPIGIRAQDEHVADLVSALDAFLLK